MKDTYTRLEVETILSYTYDCFEKIYRKAHEDTFPKELKSFFDHWALAGQDTIHEIENILSK